eukprot:2976606-Amphidinium_carterae.3
MLAWVLWRNQRPPPLPSCQSMGNHWWQMSDEVGQDGGHLSKIQTKLDLLEKWAHGVDATLAKLAGDQKQSQPTLPTGQAAPPPHATIDVQMTLKAAADLSSAQGIQIQQLMDDLAKLRMTCTSAAGSASTEANESGTSVTAHTEDGQIKQDLRKLWALYHRLSMGMRDKGVLFPEKPSEAAPSLALDPPPPPPPPAVPSQPAAGVSNAKTQEQVSIVQLSALVSALCSESSGLQQITNILWSWMTTLAAKVQDVSPLIPMVPLITSQFRGDAQLAFHSSGGLQFLQTDCDPSGTPLEGSPGAPSCRAHGGYFGAHCARSTLGASPLAWTNSQCNRQIRNQPDVAGSDHKGHLCVAEKDDMIVDSICIVSWNAVTLAGEKTDALGQHDRGCGLN